MRRIVPVQLRVYLPIPKLERQFAAYLGTPTRARGYPPIEGDNALIVEVSPALAIERVTDLALRSVPEIEPGILYVERQFGVLEVHHRDQALVDRAGAAILEGIGATPADALRPRILYADVIEDITDQHAVIINRNREASMVLPGETLLVYEVVPGAARRGGGQRGRAGGARCDARDRVDDRRGRAHLPERRQGERRAGPRRDHPGARVRGGP